MHLPALHYRHELRDNLVYKQTWTKYVKHLSVIDEQDREVYNVPSKWKTPLGVFTGVECRFLFIPCNFLDFCVVEFIDFVHPTFFSSNWKGFTWRARQERAERHRYYSIIIECAVCSWICGKRRTLSFSHFAPTTIKANPQSACVWWTFENAQVAI